MASLEEVLVGRRDAQPGGEEDGKEHEVEDVVDKGRPTLGRGDFAEDCIDALRHLLAAKRRPDALGTLLAHARKVGVGHGEGGSHDGGPGRDVVGVAQPAGLGVADGLDGPARVGGEDGDAGEHGLEGHDAKVLVGGGVDEQAGGAEERRLEGVGDGEEEEDLTLRGEGAGLGALDREVAELEGGG